MSLQDTQHVRLLRLLQFNADHNRKTSLKEIMRLGIASHTKVISTLRAMHYNIPPAELHTVKVRGRYEVHSFYQLLP